jgi:hypothetical protein
MVAEGRPGRIPDLAIRGPAPYTAPVRPYGAGDRDGSAAGRVREGNSVQKTMVAILFLVPLLGGVASAEDTTQKYGFHPESFEIRAFVQPRYSYAFGGEDYPYSGETPLKKDNTFEVKRARFLFTSEVAPRVVGRLQVSAAPDKVEALEMWFRWTPLKDHPAYSVQAGQFKKPFSYQEFVVPPSNLPLIDRPFMNTFLGQNLHVSSYDIGAMATADLWQEDIPVKVDFAVMNGNLRGVAPDPDHRKQLVARAAWTPVPGLSVGVDGAANRYDVLHPVFKPAMGGESEAPAADLTVDPGSGDARWFGVWSADAVLERSGLQFMTELAGGENTSNVYQGSVALTPHFLGWYGQAVYTTSQGWKPGLRIEVFDPDVNADRDRRTIVTGQIARAFSPNFEWQVDWVYISLRNGHSIASNQMVSQWTVRM